MSSILLPSRQPSDPVDPAARLMPAAPEPPRRRRRGRRTQISRLDRPWAGHWSAVMVTPVRMPSVETLRALWRQLMEAHPGAPITCRIDPSGWIPVPEPDRDAFVRSVVVPIADPDDTAADQHLAGSLHLLAADQPILIGVGTHSLMLLFHHQLGDGATVTQLIRALLHVDLEGLSALTDKAGLADVVRATGTQARAHGRAWWSYAWRRLVAPRARRSDPAADLDIAAQDEAMWTVPDEPRPSPQEDGGLSVPRPEERTAIVSVRWTNAEVRQIAAWRSRHAQGVSITPVLTAAIHQALVDAGLPMASDGFHTLVDLRRYLPGSEPGFLAGNLAKSMRLDVNPSDVVAVAQASQEMLESARPVLSTVLGSITARGSRPESATSSDDPTDGPVAMTFNSMPSMPGLSELPWLPGAAPQYVGLGYPARPRSITIFALRLPEHTQVTAAFPTSLIGHDEMRRTLQAIPGAIDHLVAAPRLSAGGSA